MILKHSLLIVSVICLAGPGCGGEPLEGDWELTAGKANAAQAVCACFCVGTITGDSTSRRLTMVEDGDARSKYYEFPEYTTKEACSQLNGSPCAGWTEVTVLQLNQAVTGKTKDCDIWVLDQEQSPPQ